MAEKRMFTKAIIDSDAFLDMPMSAQALYFHLNMRADDDGFVNNPKKIVRMLGASEDDLKLLLAKRFVLGFDSGVIVIKHWRLHNTLRKDRYHPTQYQEELKALQIKESGAYTDGLATTWQPLGNHLATENSIEEISIDKESIDKSSCSSGDNNNKTSRRKFNPPTVEEVAQYINENSFHINAEHFIDYYEANGWLVGKNKMKDWKATVRNWERREQNNTSQKQSNSSSQGSRRELFARLYKEHSNDV